MLNHRLSCTSLSIGLLLFGFTSQASASMNAELLRADFNDKPLNTQIDAGGASVGEPVSVPADLHARVRAAPFATPSLHFKAATSGARSARFDFIDGEEIHSGELRISFTLHTPPVADRFRFSISDQVTASATFGGLDFRSDGAIFTIESPTVIGSYLPNQDLRVEYIYQVAGGTFDLFLNGVQIFNDRAQGPATQEKGIGALFFGFPTSTSDQEWVVDDIHVVRTPALLNADFDDKPDGVQIGTGGASVGEPVFVPAVWVAKVQANRFATPALVIEPTTNGSSSSSRFEFVNDREIVDGELRISFRLRTAPIPEQIAFSITEQGSSVHQFGGLTLYPSGDIRVSDATGLELVSSFLPGDELFVEFRYALDAGTYDLYINRALILDDRNHGVVSATRGIGSMLVSILSTAASEWVLDDIYVYQPDVLFQDGFD